MSTELHAFTAYKVIEDEIHYENDQDYDIAYGNWHYVYTIIEYGNFLLGKSVSLPTYNHLDDADLVKEEGMNLVEPKNFIEICETVINSIEQLIEGENPLICEDDWLYDYDKSESFEEQKNKILYYSKMLLNWARQGLYFVEEAVH